MNTLALDIGGTKFTVALFEDQRMIRRESRFTDREGGRDWMLDQIGSLALQWTKETPVEWCGIGFGGPVDFARQTVALSTHVEGWKDLICRDIFPHYVESRLSWTMTRTSAHWEKPCTARAGDSVRVSLDPLDRDRRRTVLEDSSLYRGADSWAGEIGHITLRSPRAGLPLRITGMFRTDVLRVMA